jgi:hypothetical protein
MRRVKMKIGNRQVNIFKIDNRRGYAAICGRCLTEGSSPRQAFERMVKAVRRIDRKKKRK